MKKDELSHSEKDELISLTKKALELVCARLGCYEGATSQTANPEHWIARAYLMTKMEGWE